MTTQKVKECLDKAMTDPKIAEALEKRDQHSDYRLKSICTKLLKQNDSPQHYKMIVRIGFDYLQKTPDYNVREDILVDVSYVLIKQTRAEVFKILKVNYVPELPNP